MIPEAEQELAHLLLVELLAHQFTYPVRWIETQECLIQQGVERQVEVGPVPTLTNMMRRTLDDDSGALDRDPVFKSRKQLLSSEKHKRELYYDYDPVDQDIAELPAPAPSSSAAPSPPSAAPSASPSPAPALAVKHIEDAPVTVRQIVQTIVSSALKRRVTDNFPWDKSIKTLAAGRSALDNEITGDLHEEFPALPDGASDVPLGDLCTALENGHPGKPGKKAERLLSRFLSSKLPSGFDRKRCADHVQQRWGFGQGRQDAVLLLAVLEQPDARLASDAGAIDFFDGLAAKHAAQHGLHIQSKAAAPAPAAAIDSAVLTLAIEQQKDQSRRHLARQARELGVDLDASVADLAAARQQVKCLQQQLDQWAGEHGDEYAAGIQSRFNTFKVRVFDSSWHWHKQHALRNRYRRTRRKIKPVVIPTECAKCHPRSFLAVSKNNDAPYALCQQCTEIFTPLFEPYTPIGFAIKEWTGLRQVTSPLEILSPSKTPRRVMQYFGAIREALPPKSTENGSPPIPANVKHAFHVHESGLFIKAKRRRRWLIDHDATATFLDMLERVASGQMSLAGKTVLMTGAGNHSIGSQLLKNMLRAGAQVLVTTSSYNRTSLQLFEDAYRHHCGPGSTLHVIPFNQGSAMDIESLVDYIYTVLHLDLDLIFPFAAISETGRGIDNIDSKSELAHRLMATNAIRLVGAVVRAKRAQHITARPAQVVLPLSPNHGLFGGDGLYAESKLALEGLFDKWKAEELQPYISLCGVIIGWTRGTGLMSHNDYMVEALQKLGVQSFSQSEMAAYIMALTAPRVLDICEREPIMADFSGNMDAVEDLAHDLKEFRLERDRKLEIQKAIAADLTLDKRLVPGPTENTMATPASLRPRANLQLKWPRLSTFDRLAKLSDKSLAGMHDLDRTVVVAGFAEIGPLGSARTRWDVESGNRLSTESIIELAWMMGLVKWVNSADAASTGWKDSESGALVTDAEMRKRYEDHILKHTGVRFMEGGRVSDRARASLYQEIALSQDLDPFEATKETAERFKHTHGDKVTVSPSPDTDKWNVALKKGAVLLAPRDNDATKIVAGCVPDGWDPKAYGIHDDVVSRVDRVTLYLLTTVVDAFLSAGITDVYEIYKHIHTSEVGNLLGSGIGATESIAKQYKDQYFGESLGDGVQSDLLQETFVNTSAAWINMMLLSSNGPTHTPVGACATALESLDTGCDLIRSGKAKLCVVGGFEDMTEEVAHGFARMKATVNVQAEMDAGREAHEMSRPMSSSRSGFVEASGAGVQIITSASLALEMGLPIHAVVAFTGTASDGISSSVPAPGKGILGFAAESPSPMPPRMLDLAWRRKRLDLRRQHIAESRELDLACLDEDLAAHQAADPDLSASDFKQERQKWIERETDRALKEAQWTLNTAFWLHEPQISPLRGALAAWGLTADDITVATMHATSTSLGDLNEAQTLHAQLTHLGRSADLPVLGVCQKALTGHGKGASGAWSVNCALQVLASGTVPGNRNLDNVDARLRACEQLLFPRDAVRAGEGGVRAVSVTSFGFGQKGAQAVVLHPDALLAALARGAYDGYAARARRRQQLASRRFAQALVRRDFVRVKTAKPFAGPGEVGALLDRAARLV